jgi:hypothetical protein
VLRKRRDSYIEIPKLPVVAGSRQDARTLNQVQVQLSNPSLYTQSIFCQEGFVTSREIEDFSPMKKWCPDVREDTKSYSHLLKIGTNEFESWCFQSSI